jgi:hypothetical protein
MDQAIADFVRLTMSTAFVIIAFVFLARENRGLDLFWGGRLFAAFFLLGAVRHGLIVTVNDSLVDTILLLVQSTLAWGIAVLGVVDLACDPAQPAAATPEP